MAGHSLILASASPRRRALLQAAGLAHTVFPADIDETEGPGERPEALVERLAREKAQAVAREHPGTLFLGADTVVVLGGRILGKPRDAAHAVELLSDLCGHTHSVWTGVALVGPGGVVLETCRVQSQVTLRSADRAELEAYVATGEPLDKAGAYALQGDGGRFVTDVRGSRTNVIGLPMDETLRMLENAGGPPAAASAALPERVAEVRAQIAQAADRAGRQPSEITLVGVSKRHPAEAAAAAVLAGLVHLGENFAQELRDKAPAVTAVLDGTGCPAPKWHFIGQLQRNKARLVVPACHCVETVDRPALAQELDRRAQALGKTLDILLQVNVSDEPQKGGVAPEGLAALLDATAAFGSLRVRGLMAIPSATSRAEAGRPAFARLRELRDAHGGAVLLPELSMGMSSDFEVAIEEGATIIRVGTALFGPRES